MNRLLLVVNLLLAAVYSLAQDPCTKFPTEKELDFQPQLFQARVALPVDDVNGRVWVKGSAGMRYYKIVKNGQEILPVRELRPPNYTGVITVPAGTITIFYGNDQIFSNNDFINVTTISKGSFENPGNFSLVFYGCLEPFEIVKKVGVAKLNRGRFDANYTMRKLFNAVCHNEPVKILNQPRELGYQYQKGTVKTTTLFSPVKMVIGTGDQVYVDAGYLNQKRNISDISAWENKKQPMPLVNTECYSDHLNRMYQSFGSFGLLNDVFHNVPSPAVWDDHEIRDGWGSQGDEYINGNLNPRLKDYYELSRQAYIQHQWILGSYKTADEEIFIKNNDDLHQEFTIGGKRVFAFDLRSNRDMNRPQVIDDRQLNAFIKWIGDSQKDEEIIIVSSIPLFLGYKPDKVFIANLLSPEGRDDIRDGWDSETNKDQRNKIITLILDNRIKKNIKPYIVSGDVHSGGILEIWYNNDRNTHLPPDEERQKRKVLCYELIATGLNHETLNEESVGVTHRFLASQKKRSQKQWRNEDLVSGLRSGDSTYHISTISRIDQASVNFGAIEFLGTATNIHLFLHRIDQPMVEQFVVEAQWNKNDLDDRDYMDIQKMTSRKMKYKAALSKERNTIYSSDLK